MPEFDLPVPVLRRHHVHVGRPPLPSIHLSGKEAAVIGGGIALGVTEVINPVVAALVAVSPFIQKWLTHGRNGEVHAEPRRHSAHRPRREPAGSTG